MVSEYIPFVLSATWVIYVIGQHQYHLPHQKIWMMKGVIGWRLLPEIAINIKENIHRIELLLELHLARRLLHARLVRLISRILML